MLVEINLLPKSYRKSDGNFKFGKAELIGLAVVSAVILTMFAVTWTMNAKMETLQRDIDDARRRTAQLQQDIRLVDGLTDMKRKIAERMQAVEKLDRHRSSWVHIMQDLTRRVPDFVWLASFKEVGPSVNAADTTSQALTHEGLPIKKVEIEGYSFTLNAVAAFMIKMMRSHFFEEIDLVYANETTFDDKRAFNFKLTTDLHYLSDEGLKSLLAEEREAEILAKR